MSDGVGVDKKADIQVIILDHFNRILLFREAVNMAAGTELLKIPQRWQASVTIKDIKNSENKALVINKELYSLLGIRQLEEGDIVNFVVKCFAQKPLKNKTLHIYIVKLRESLTFRFHRRLEVMAFDVDTLQYLMENRIREFNRYSKYSLRAVYASWQNALAKVAVNTQL